LARQGDAIKQAEYLKKFRADNIVRDCEAIRNFLTLEYPEGQRAWSIIGQSFGGFCAATYLSKLSVPVGLYFDQVHIVEPFADCLCLIKAPRA
jgi:hypothetical protein